MRSSPPCRPAWGPGAVNSPRADLAAAVRVARGEERLRGDRALHHAGDPVHALLIRCAMSVIKRLSLSPGDVDVLPAQLDLGTCQISTNSDNWQLGTPNWLGAEGVHEYSRQPHVRLCAEVHTAEAVRGRPSLSRRSPASRLAKEACPAHGPERLDQPAPPGLREERTLLSSRAGISSYNSQFK
jgi:hypothetical protein